VLLAIVATLLAPSAVFAADGEVGDIGDTDSITDVYLSSSRPTVKADYVKDCPTGISACVIEVQFRYKCPEVWCLNWTYQGWKGLGAGGVAQADCIGNDDNYWEVSYRVKWNAPTTKTVEYYGELEAFLTAGASIGHKIIAEALFNVTNNAGLKTSTKVETDTGTSAYSTPTTVATSGGRTLRTC
jgi:hypothetical protein